MNLESVIDLHSRGELRGEFNLTNENYHSPLCPGLSKSDLDKVSRSVMHYIHSKNEGHQSTDAMILGSYFHDSILSPELMENYAVGPRIDKRTKAGKEAASAFAEMNIGKTIITMDMYETVTNMREAVFANSMCCKLLEGAAMEKALFWTDPETNLLCKCKPDAKRNDGIIIDLKSTEDASNGEFARSALKYAYHKQAAYYLDGATNALNTPYEYFIFICVEKQAPHGVAIYNLPKEYIEVGRNKYKADLLKFNEITSKGAYQGYPQVIQDLQMPNYIFTT